MKIRLYYFIIVFLCCSGKIFSQEPKLYDKLEEKAVIGFPGITTQQLSQISVEFAKYPQIETAKFIYGDHNCMLITFMDKSRFSVYGELLKVISSIYDINQCYLKPTSAFNEISYKAGSEYNVK